MPVGWTSAGEPPSLGSLGGTVTLVEGAGFCVCADCREHVRSSFDVDTMVAGYETLYRKALVSRTPTRHDVRLPGGRGGAWAPVATGTAA